MNNEAFIRACLAGLRLHQTHSGVAAPPICSSTVELDSPVGAEDMCLAEITTSTLKIEDLNELPSFVIKSLAFFPLYAWHWFLLFFIHVRYTECIPFISFFFSIPVRTNKPAPPILPPPSHTRPNRPPSPAPQGCARCGGGGQSLLRLCRIATAHQHIGGNQHEGFRELLDEDKRGFHDSDDPESRPPNPA
jgi:hypothetical protein